MIKNKVQTITEMMIHSQIYLKRIVYNSKLNREKFITNKKKMNERKTIQIRKFYTYQHHEKDSDKDPDNDPKFDWNLVAMCSIIAYVVRKMNNKDKKR
jgi:hypothetical protein